MVTVTAPTNYTGTVVGVALVDGRGATNDPAALAYFRRHGYILDEHQDDEPTKQRRRRKPADQTEV